MRVLHRLVHHPSPITRCSTMVCTPRHITAKKVNPFGDSVAAVLFAVVLAENDDAHMDSHEGLATQHVLSGRKPETRGIHQSREKDATIYGDDFVDVWQVHPTLPILRDSVEKKKEKCYTLWDLNVNQLRAACVDPSNDWLIDWLDWLDLHKGLWSDIDNWKSRKEQLESNLKENSTTWNIPSEFAAHSQIVRGEDTPQIFLRKPF